MDEIDTVLTVFPDVQGRLMGKRVVGRHFLEHIAGDGVHACAYLLTVDVDMEPLPGYRFASWATGYQDMKAVRTSARSGGSLAREDRARLLRPLHGGGGADRGQPAADPPAPGRAGGQARVPGHGGVGARALPQGVVRRGAREAVPRG